MKVKSIPSSWISRDGLRLDCNPYMTGALEARIHLEDLACQKQRLADLTKGHAGGIYNGPHFSRQYVEDADHGVPFLGSSSMLQADLSNLPYLRRKDAESPKLSYLKIQPGMTLISCSGTIGRMVYARPDMSEMWSSQHIMKVVPDEAKVPPGYLYAFLSSKFGVPLVTSGTYGSIIQSIEPEHIAGLPVPRLGEELEMDIHEIVERAAMLRSTAAAALSQAISDVETEIGVPPFNTRLHERRYEESAVSVQSICTARRLDAFFYNPMAKELDRWAENHANGYWRLGSIAHVFDVPPFKHIYVDSNNGVPFYTSGDLFKLDRACDKHLSKTRTKNLQKYVLEAGWVLLARSGQLGGIIGRPQLADSSLEKATASDHVIRIVPIDEEVPAGYIFAYLSTPTVGYSLMTRTLSGSSVPALWPIYLNEVNVIKAKPDFMTEVGDRVQKAFEYRVVASGLENQARRLVEQVIEGVE
jgi:type I restriction enzyme S subunit